MWREVLWSGFYTAAPRRRAQGKKYQGRLDPRRLVFIDARCGLDGPINAERSTADVTQFLVPTLLPCDVVMTDNPGSHKGVVVRKAICAAGDKLIFLPPYSPNLDPIEQMFAKRKLVLRKAAERTVEATWQRIGELLDAFPPNECASYLRNSEYASA